jgi:hypothetical protein
MSQVLQYGFPVHDWLLCENPVCEDRATFMATEVGTNIKDPKEIFGCIEHISQLTIAKPSMRLVKLKVPGERNAAPADTAKKS